MEVVITIKGEVPSLKNSIRVSGRRVYETSDIRTYKAAFNIQIPFKKRANISVPVHVSIMLYKKDHRKDAVNQTAIIFDCLQHSGVIKNDRLVESWDVESDIDKEDPRAELKIKERGI